MTHDTSNRATLGFLLGLVTGTLGGAALTLLLAPRSGQETLSLLHEQATDIRDALDEQVQNAKRSATSVASQVKESANTLVDKVGSKVSEFVPRDGHNA